MTAKNPEAFAPGEYISEELEARGWSQLDLAEILGRPAQAVNEIIKGKRAITPDTARGLANAFGNTAQVWLNLQSAYDLSRLQQSDENLVSRKALLRQFCDEMRRALREEYIRDAQGRRVRAKHAIRREGESGYLWADIHTAPREHMVEAFGQRRDQIIADCAQLKADVDSYNENQNGGDPIQLGLDFTRDVREYELGRE